MDSVETSDNQAFKSFLQLLGEIYGQPNLKIIEVSKRSAVVSVNYENLSFRPLRIDSNNGDYGFTQMFRSKVFAKAASITSKRKIHEDSLSTGHSLTEMMSFLEEYSKAITAYGIKYDLTTEETKDFANMLELFSRTAATRKNLFLKHKDYLKYIAALTKTTHSAEMKLEFLRNGTPVEIVSATQDSPEEWVKALIREKSVIS